MNNTNKEKITIPLLAPLGLAFLVLLGAFVFGVCWLQRRHISNEVRSRIEGVEGMFQLELKEDAELMDTLVDLLEEDKVLQNAWLAKDRDALLGRAQVLFKTAHRSRITHSYFHGLEKVCFLRVHKPQRYGDYIERFTMDKAVREGKSVYGIELGPLGTFTLRVVHPWWIAGELVGYIELGEEIEHITRELKKIIGAELIFVINKSYLNRSYWEEGMKMMGRTGNWEQFSEVVIIDSTIEQIPPVLGENMERHHIAHEKFLFEVSVSGRKYRSGFVPLFDAGGREVGEIIVLKDVTEQKAALRTLSTVMIVMGAVIGAVLLILFYFYIGRIEQKLTEAYDAQHREIIERRCTEEKLTKEIKQRCRTEEQLQRNISELERFNKVAVGRELRVVELKKEINALLGELGREEKYQTKFDEVENKPLSRNVG